MEHVIFNKCGDFCLNKFNILLINALCQLCSPLPYWISERFRLNKTIPNCCVSSPTQKRHGKKCNKSEEIIAPEELDVMDEAAMSPWSDSQ